MSGKGEKGDKGNKELLKPAKVLAGGTSGGNSGKQPPKRPRSDSAQNVSVEELTVISQQMDGLATDIQTVRDDLKSIMRKDEMETFIQETVTKIISNLNENIDTLVDLKVDEKTRPLLSRMTEIEEENERLRKELVSMKSQFASVKTRMLEADDRSKASLAKANYNEQYSRKNNIKVLSITESKDETEDELLAKVDTIFTDRGVPIDKNKILAMHRIPGKPGNPKPVLIKFTNNNEKTKVMKKRSEFKTAGNRLVDDVTKLNAGLIKDLSDHRDIESAWYFNGAVFGKSAATGKRHKFDLYDDVSAVLRA